MSQHREHTATPPTSPNGDAYAYTYASPKDVSKKLNEFLEKLQNEPKKTQQEKLTNILAALEKEEELIKKNNTSLDDILEYNQMMLTVSHHLKKLGELHPESRKDKAIRLTVAFAEASANNTATAAQATYKVTKPIAVKGAKLAWAATSWVAGQIWDIARGEGGKIIQNIDNAIDDAVYEMKRGVNNMITDIRDDISNVYYKHESGILGTATMASAIGIGALVWNLSHTNPDAAPENRGQLALNDQPKTAHVIEKGKASQEIAGLENKKELATTKPSATQSKTPQSVPQKQTEKSTRQYGSVKAKQRNMNNITMIAQKAYNAGLDKEAIEYIVTITSTESKGDAHAMGPGGKARGLCQFIESTAKRMGLKFDAPASDPKSVFNAEANADACVKFTQQNSDQLKKILGRRPTSGELYLAHQQGAAGATALLFNPSRNAIDVLYAVNSKKYSPETARKISKISILGNGGREDMTAREFTNKWTRHHKREMKIFEIEFI